MTRVIVFEEAGKEYWIKKVNYLCGKDGVQLNKSRERSEISIKFSSCITILDFTHVHIVLFACLIERLKCLNYTMTAFIEDKNLRRFILMNYMLVNIIQKESLLVMLKLIVILFSIFGK